MNGFSMAVRPFSTLVTLCLVAAASTFLLCQATGREPAPPQQIAEAPDSTAATQSPALGDESATLIEQLASGEFAQRRQAFLQLWRAGKESLPLIESAKSSSARPVVEAAKLLEILIDLGIAPDRLQDSARLLESIGNPNPQSILELCQLRYWNVATRMLAVNPELVRQFQDAYGRYMLSRLVDVAIEQEQLELAWPIIRQVLTPAQVAWLAHKTGCEIERPIPYITAQQHFFEGQIDQALQTKIPIVAQIPMLTRSGRWERMTDDTVMSILAGRVPSPSQLAAQAVLTEVAGDLPKAQALWLEALPDPPSATATPAAEQPLRDETPTSEPDSEAPASPTPDSPNTAVDDAELVEQARIAHTVQLIETIDQGGVGGQANKNQLLTAMLYTGRVAPIGAYLEKHAPLDAFGFYLAGNDHTAALAAIGLQTDLSNLEEWFAQRQPLIAEELNQRGVDNEQFELCARLVSILDDLGYESASERLLDDLVELAQASRGKQTELWSRAILPWLGRSETRQLALRTAQREFSRMGNECQIAVLKGLFPEFGDAVVALWATAPSADEATKWKDIERLYVFDQAAFGADYPAVMESWLRRALKHMSEQQLTSDGIISLGRLASGLGDSDLAIEILLTDLSPGYGQAPSPNLHWTEAARIFIELGKPENALPLLSSVRRTGANPHYAYTSEVQALLLSGQFEMGRTLERARWLRPLATATRFQGYSYFTAALEFSESQQFEQTAEVAEAAFLLAELGSFDLYRAASLYGDALEELKQPTRRADVLRSAWIEGLQPFASSMQIMVGDGYFSSLRYAAQKEKLARAIACVHDEDWTTFAHTVAVAQQLQPQDIEVVCQCYPLLLERGQQQSAEDLFSSYQAHMQGQLERWPEDATALNNLAWMYSQCDRELAAARELSQRAVNLAPSSAVFLDTLAEIEFRSGNPEAAIRIMRDCVRLDPRERHYRENLVRFRQPTHPR